MKKIVRSSLLVMILTLWTQFTAFAAETEFTSISVGSDHTVALKGDGTVWCWGSNGYGQLGDGTTTNYSTPVQVLGLTDVVFVAAGDCHSLAIKSDGTVWTWGRNNYGQLGNGTYSSAAIPVPTKVVGLKDVQSLTIGSSFNLAIKEDGTVWTWGYNGHGLFGDGTSSHSNVPKQISELSNIKQAVIGSNHCLAIKKDGTVLAWGANGYGQLGTGTTVNSTTPVQVYKLTDVISVAAGNNHSLALKTDGTVWSWGYNGDGELGNGSTTNHYIPKQVNELNNIKAIDAGYNHSTALKTDGTVWSWGYNYYGQIGDGTKTIASTPKQVIGLGDVETISSNNNYNTVIKSDSSIWKWGNGSNLLSGTHITPTKVNNVNVHLDGSHIGGTIEMDIISDKYKIGSDEEFEVEIVLKNAQEIYAEDMSLTYNSELFQFVKGEIYDSNKQKIYHAATTTPGAVRYILASNGAEHDLNNDTSILKLTFKSLKDGQGDITVTSGKVANGMGEEFNVIGHSKTFEVLTTSDVNHDGKFTIGDLAIASRLLGTPESSWDEFAPDVDLNGSVETLDLAKIVEKILK